MKRLTKDDIRANIVLYEIAILEALTEKNGEFFLFKRLETIKGAKWSERHKYKELRLLYKELTGRVCL